jgi:cytochrome c
MAPSAGPSFETHAAAARRRAPQDEVRGLLLLVVAALVCLLAASASAAEPKLDIGRLATPQEIAGWDIDVRPDGQGLPPGSGTVKAGEAVYMARCAACHGEFGESAARWPQVAGGQGSLSSHDPVKTVGSYFAHLSTVFDYVRHAMPFGDAQSLTNDELYAVVAYMLFLNDIVDDKFVLSRETFGSVKMPNAGGFYDDDRETTEKAFWNPNPCMTDCKPEAKVIGRARVIDVTPDDKRRPAAD